VIVLVAGGIAVGKTTIAAALAERLDGRVVRVRDALAEVLGRRLDDRGTLQRLGADLDRRTSGRWLAEYLAEAAESAPRLVVDSCRTRRQTEAVLERLPTSRLVYLDAHEDTRRARYALSAATDPIKAGSTYDAAVDHDTERLVALLRPLADTVVETDDLDTEQTVAELLSQLCLDTDNQ
jgi:shikimate kinase